MCHTLVYSRNGNETKTLTLKSHLSLYKGAKTIISFSPITSTTATISHSNVISLYLLFHLHFLFHSSEISLSEFAGTLLHSLLCICSTQVSISNFTFHFLEDNNQITLQLVNYVPKSLSVLILSELDFKFPI